MNKQQLILMSTVATGLIYGAFSPAIAGEVEKSMALSGHINRALVLSDNGESTTFGQIDNTGVSGSRFRIIGSANSSNLTFKATTELGVQANGGAGSHANSSTTSLNIRHSFISVGNAMGTLNIGHTDAADADLTSAKLIGTGEAGFYDDKVITGEELRVNGDTGTASSSITVDGILSDSTSGRGTNIHYQTPSMGGFSASVGFSETDNASGRIDYSADYDGTKVVATAGWGSRGGTDAIENVWGGSMGISLAGGLNASVAYTQRNLNGDVATNAGLSDPESLGASIGYTMGDNGITAWYQQVEDLGANGNEAETYALVAQHNMPAYGTTIYGGIQNVDYSTTAIKYDDLTAGWVGIKVTF